MSNEIEVQSTLDGRYHIRREIACGETCVVSEAEHALTGRVVALKTLKREHVTKESAKLRLLREARVLELSRHPSIVEVLDAAIDTDGTPYVVMEKLEGRPLSGVLAARGSLPVADTLAIAGQVCRAMTEAHARGVIHRDLKPGNLFLVRDKRGVEVVKILDFSRAALSQEAVARSDKKITKLGEIVGTPEYIAPELLMQHGEADPRCDQYSLAVSVFECLAGSVPFSGGFGDVVLKVNTQPIPSVNAQRPEVEPNVAAALQRAMSREPGDRFPDLATFLQALSQGRSDALASSQLLPGSAARAAPPPLPAAGPAPELVQRRRHERQPFVTPVRMVTDAGVTYDGRSEDISEGGLLFVIDRACESGLSAEVRFAMPLTGRVVKVRVTTRWVKDGRGRAAAGLEFESLPQELREEIARYVALMGKTYST